MNSTISDDLSREHLALEAAKCIQNILTNSQKVKFLHKELLEINLSVTAYIEESKQRLDELRLNLAHEAKSSHKVVEILSEKCKHFTRAVQISLNPSLKNAEKNLCLRLRPYWLRIYFERMSTPPPAPQKRILLRTNIKRIQIEDNNNSNRNSERQQARKFITWYKRMIDNERQNLCLYLSDDVMLEYFGRTIKTRKKVAAFFKHDMQCSRHDFTTVESIEKIQMRQDLLSRRGDESLASPLNSPEIINSNIERSGKRQILRSQSPEWAESCKPADETSTEIRRSKPNESLNDNKPEVLPRNGLKRAHSEDRSEINSKGDNMLGRRAKRKCVPVTPPNCEVGQGDCIPSTSGTDSNRSHDTLNAQLPKLAVECNGYIEFTRTRNNRATDSMKWERKCKVQISYSEDPLNIGEYIIWALLYTDESKCRRNLLSAFEEIAIEEGMIK